MKEASLKVTYFLIPNTKYSGKYKTTEVVKKKMSVVSQSPGRGKEH